MLKLSAAPLCEEYDVAVLDLDGVVYVDGQAVNGAVEHLRRAADAGMHLAYVTNNASRPPATVGQHLRDLGIDVADADVVTSAQAAARLVAQQVEPGTNVFVIGGDGLFEALAEHDLVAVQSIDADAGAVVSGYAPDLRWRTVIDGAILVKSGLPWVASNTDLTVPTAHGPGPGNGVLVGAVARYADRQPMVAGKPQTPLFEETLLRVGGKHPLVVGDRLDTDIEGAANAGFDSLLVMTGVTELAELVAAKPALRPTYVAADLAGLVSTHPAPDGGQLGGWRSRVERGSLVVSGDGGVDDWWRVVATTAWAHLDEGRGPVDVSSLAVPG